MEILDPIWFPRRFKKTTQAISMEKELIGLFEKNNGDKNKQLSYGEYID